MRCIKLKKIPLWCRVITYLLIIFIIILFFWFIYNLGIKYSDSIKEDENTFIEYNVDIVKTVAHLDLDSEEYELIYSDTENDIAYYRYVGERTHIHEGDVVYNSKGVESTVTATNVYGFYITYNDSFTTGMSGTVVFNSDNEPVGYVSSNYGNTYVYCIWY